MQSKTLDNKSKYLLMVEDTASVAALYRSYLTPLEIDINIVGTIQEGAACIITEVVQQSQSSPKSLDIATRI